MMRILCFSFITQQCIEAVHIGTLPGLWSVDLRGDEISNGCPPSPPSVLGLHERDSAARPALAVNSHPVTQSRQAAVVLRISRRLEELETPRPQDLLVSNILVIQPQRLVRHPGPGTLGRVRPGQAQIERLVYLGVIEVEGGGGVVEPVVPAGGREQHEGVPDPLRPRLLPGQLRPEDL